MPFPSHGSRLLEAYARQNDFIVQYGEGRDDTYRYHLYWRILGQEPSAALFAIELWLGVQTGLLESTPTLRVACSLANSLDQWKVYGHSELADSNSSFGADVAALVAHSQGFSGVWLIEPTDQMHATLEASPDEPSITLFGHFMEKGVIRRGRMRFYLVAGEASVEQVANLYSGFAASELPLTA